MRVLYFDSWCVKGLNRIINEPFKLTKSVQQGCPLAPFFYFFIADCLGYLVKNVEGAKGITLHGLTSKITNQEFADDTKLYLIRTHKNLLCTTQALDTFKLVARNQINWNKSTGIRITNKAKPFKW